MKNIEETITKMNEVGITPQIKTVGGTLIYVCDIVSTPGAEILKEMDSVYESLNSNDGWYKKWDSLHFSDPYFKENLIEKHQMNTFWEELQKHLLIYFTTLKAYHITDRDEIKYATVNSWMTKSKKGSYSHVHSHNCVDVSGVFYYKTNEEDGSIFFPQINPQVDSGYITQGINDDFVTSPRVGRMILFPGWMRHGVQTNTTDNERVSFAFNLMIER